MAQAQQTALGPFADFLRRGADLFYYTRNALFVVTAFYFIKLAWTAITEGKIEWEKIIYVLIALVLLGTAGYVVEFFGGQQVTTALNQTATQQQGSMRHSTWQSPQQNR
jgi:hypothetical protein